MPFEKGNNANPKGRPKGVGSIKTAAMRCYESIVKPLGSQMTAGRLRELMDEWCKTATLEQLLDMAERFGGPVIREVVKDNKIELTASDELAEALRAALTSHAKAKHDSH